MESIKTIFSYFLSYRLATIIFTIFLINLIQVPNDSPLRLWTQWDGGHYIGIAENGYKLLQQFAFFPLYPILIKTLTFIGIDASFAALLISNIFLIGALTFLYKLGKEYNLTEKTNQNTILFLITFPTAFFFLAAYTESLLLFFTTAALYYAKKQNWFLTALLAGLATFTKFTGVLLVFLLLFEYISQHKNFSFTKLNFKKLLKYFEPIFYILTLGLSGLFLYMFYLYYSMNNSLLFIDIQSHWGRTTSFSNPYTVLVQNFEKFVWINNQLSITVQSLEVLIIFITLFLFPFICKKFGYLLGFYTLLVCTFTLFSGKTDSSLRYILTAFPIFWLLSSWADKSKLFFYSYLLTAIMLQTLFLTLFLMGNWVG